MKDTRRTNEQALVGAERQAIGKRARIERRDESDVFQVDIRVQHLAVAAVDHSRSIAASEDMGSICYAASRIWGTKQKHKRVTFVLEGRERDRLCAQCDALLAREFAARQVELEAEQVAVAQAAQQERRAIELAEQHRARHDFASQRFATQLLTSSRRISFASEFARNRL